MILENYFSVSFVEAIFSRYIPDPPCKSVRLVSGRYTRCSISENCIKLNGTKLWNKILLANYCMFAFTKYSTST